MVKLFSILFFCLLGSGCQTSRPGHQAIWKSEHYALYRDSVVQTPFVARALSSTELVSNYRLPAQAAPTASRWKLSGPLAAFPQYQSDYPLADALYNLSLEEMGMAIAPDSTFRTGREGPGGPVSYSILLAMAALQPRVSRHSLLRQVKNGRLLPEAGTGGAYPLASDRLVWALAAWELYKVTGEESWLRQAYPIIRNTLEEDLKYVFDPLSGLFRGAAPLPEGREQPYPAWMQPADRFESESLGTNVLFYQACMILSAMATLLQDMPTAGKYHQLAVNLRKSINDHFWLPEKGYYGQYRYGRHYKILSPRSDALGEALAILSGLTDIGRQQSLVEKTPVTALGIPRIYPPIPTHPADASQGIRPLVQACWALATAKAGHEAALLASMGALYRPAALLLTHQESQVALHGDAAGARVPAGPQVGSVAGNLSLVYKVLFGLDFQPQSLVFRPVVPRALQGRRQLTNFRYRAAILDIEITGYGNQIRSFRLNDQKLSGATLPANLTGRHAVKIELANNELSTDKINQVAVVFPPGVPQVTYSAGTLAWTPVAGAVAYRVLKNGRHLLRTTMLSAQVPAAQEAYAEYQVIAVDARGHESFAPEPVVVVAPQAQQRYELESFAAPASRPYPGYSGQGFVALSSRQHTRLRLSVTIPETGWYAIDFRYASDSGPAQAASLCPMRTLRNGPDLIGTIVLPRRSNGAGADWGFTNAVQVKLKKGSHTFTLAAEPNTVPVPGEGNEALVDYMRLTLIKSE